LDHRNLSQLSLAACGLRADGKPADSAHRLARTYALQGAPLQELKDGANDETGNRDLLITNNQILCTPRMRLFEISFLSLLKPNSGQGTAEHFSRSRSAVEVVFAAK